jgi:hypothetical protein
MTNHLKHKLLPSIGVFVSFILFALAAALYPGGYDWAGDFISRFFRSSSTEEIGVARYVAILAMFVLCVSVALTFKLISTRPRKQAVKKIIEIGGIGSTVYAFLIVTPMHDLLVGIALLFFVPALGAALHFAREEGQLALWGIGVGCLGLLMVSATMYYGNLFWDLLPVAQKVSLAACVGWLLALQLTTKSDASTGQIFPSG